MERSKIPPSGDYLGVSEVGHLTAEGQRLTIKGYTEHNWSLLRMGLLLWRLSGKPWWLIKQVARLMIRNEGKQ